MTHGLEAASAALTPVASTLGADGYDLALHLEGGHLRVDVVPTATAWSRSR